MVGIHNERNSRYKFAHCGQQRIDVARMGAIQTNGDKVGVSGDTQHGFVNRVKSVGLRLIGEPETEPSRRSAKLFKNFGDQQCLVG